MGHLMNTRLILQEPIRIKPSRTGAYVTQINSREQEEIYPEFRINRHPTKLLRNEKKKEKVKFSKEKIGEKTSAARNLPEESVEGVARDLEA